MPRPTSLAAAGIVLLGAASLGRAHFPLLLPEGGSPVAKQGQPAALVFELGHPFEVERAPVERPAAVEVLTPSGKRLDLSSSAEALGARDRIKDGKAPGWRLAFAPEEKGDHLVTLRRGPRRHKDVLVEEHAKLVLHVEPVQRGWDRRAGQPLEVLPLTRPYGIPVGAAFRAQVVRGERGEPAAGVLVEVEYKNDVAPKELPPEPFITRVEKANERGEVAVTLDQKGWWVLAASLESTGPQGQRRVTRSCLWVYVGRW